MLAPNIINEIERRALEIAAEFDLKDGKRMAEILPVRASWHMVKAQPGKEGKVAGQLAEFGFGAFVPRFDQGSVLPMLVRRPDGKRVTENVNVGNRLIFPTRVFVWVWDLMDHWRRIRRCPDVVSIVVDSAERPVPISDEQINRIQALQFSLIPKGKKKRKRYQGAADDFRATMYCRSFWTVDSDERNRALDQSLGLGS